MSVEKTAGVSAVGAILAALTAHGHHTVAGICETYKIPRSTAFQVVGKLVSAGFVTRYGKGQLALGPQAVRLGYASADLAALAGPAEAAMSWLRNETGGQVALLTAGQPVKRLVSIPDIAFESDIEMPVCDGGARTVALVQLLCPIGATRAGRSHALHCCERVVATLEASLNGSGDQN